MDRTDCVVIGAGAIGLACARALASRGREVLVLEREAAIGTGISSRNSEVIHSGIYYRTGSLKAQLCVEGRERLYRYCVERGVAHLRLGKLIVATSPAETGKLEAYRNQAEVNGAGPLDLLGAQAVARLEPAVSCVAALWSPATGIIDAHEYMLALRGDIEALGGSVATRCEVVGARALEDGVVLEVGGSDDFELHARCVVNAAGLDAPALSRALVGMNATAVPRSHYAIGHYYSLSGRAPFRHLVYPVATSGGLGVHVTLDLAGQARFGPDVRWIERVDYTFDDSRRSEFAAAIRSYYPDLDEQRLQPAYTGIRPKIVGAGEPDADFVIAAPAQHGVAGYVALYGIESPGLTASLALAERVAATFEAPR